MNLRLAEAGQSPLSSEIVSRFDAYLALLQKWNARTNLTAIRDPEQILRRHFVESIAVARALPAEIRTLLDFGSGAGFPGIPIALCRPEIAVTLAESQNKKAAFLQEAARTLQISLEIHAGRAETLRKTFDCVTLRAVDRMESALRAASALVKPAGWIAILTSETDAANILAILGTGLEWQPPVPLPFALNRILLQARKG